MNRLVLLSALYAFFCGQALAQSVPALINYQGQLTDVSGAPLPTADYVLTFSIYDADRDGVRVWGPQVFDGASGQGHGPKIPVVQGFFNVMLGAVDTNGVSIKDAFKATNRFVEIKVGNNNAMTPRQQVLSAPFAIKAESAEKLTTPGGVSTAAVSVAGNGNVGIGTTSPQSRLVVDGGDLLINRGATSANEAGQLAISTYANTNSALKLGYFYNPGVEAAGVLQALDGGQPAKLLLNPKGGSVGIGTASPQAKLDVNGNIAIDAGNELQLASGDNSVSSRIKNPTVGSRQIAFLTGDASLQERMRIDGSGNVGIGTFSPQRKLDVAGDALFRGKLGIEISTADNNNPPGIAYSDEAFLYEGEYLNHYGFGFRHTSEWIPNGPNAYVAAYFGIDFFTGGYNRMRIAPGGNVGIGTAAPAATLDVAGTVKATAFQGDGSQLSLAAGVSIPVGGVIMWWGTLATIPANFELCNGAAPTTSGATLGGLKPDLRDRFPKGATSAASDVKSIPVVGGVHTIAARQSGGTAITIAQMPSHNHDNGINNKLVRNDGNATTIETDPTVGEIDTQNAAPIVAVGGGQAHDHTIPWHDNRPAFLEMFFIIRVK
jgi:hypothetical protein